MTSLSTKWATHMRIRKPPINSWINILGAEKQFVVSFIGCVFMGLVNWTWQEGFMAGFYTLTAHIVERKIAQSFFFFTISAFCTQTFFLHWPVWSCSVGHHGAVDLALCLATEALKEKRFNTIKHCGRFSSRHQIEDTRGSVLTEQGQIYWFSSTMGRATSLLCTELLL